MNATANIPAQSTVAELWPSLLGESDVNRFYAPDSEDPYGLNDLEMPATFPGEAQQPSELGKVLFAFYICPTRHFNLISMP